MNLSRTRSIAVRASGSVVLGVALAGGVYTAWAEQIPASAIAADWMSKWTDARPSATVSVVPISKPGQFLVRVKITDLATSSLLAEPRLVTAAGVPATMETGTDKLMVRFVVTVDPSGRQAAYTSEVRRNGQVESSQSAVLAIDLADVVDFPFPPTPTGEARRYNGPEKGQFLFKLSVSASDAKERSCVADVFAGFGRADLAAAMSGPADGKQHEASFSSTVPTVTESTDRLVGSLSKCHLGGDISMTWSLGRMAA